MGLQHCRHLPHQNLAATHTWYASVWKRVTGNKLQVTTVNRIWKMTLGCRKDEQNIIYTNTTLLTDVGNSLFSVVFLVVCALLSFSICTGCRFGIINDYYYSTSSVVCIMTSVKFLLCMRFLSLSLFVLAVLNLVTRAFFCVRNWCFYSVSLYQLTFIF